MPNLSVTRSWFPGADEPIEYPYGMPKPEVKDMSSVMKTAVENTVRAGGIAYSELPELERIKRQLRIK